MTATFNEDLGTARDRIRFALGDTDVSDALVSDELIASTLAQKEDSESAASVALARYLAAKFTRKVDTDVDDQSYKWSQLAAQYTKLAASLEALAEGTTTATSSTAADTFGGGIVVGGATSDSVWNARDDLDKARNADECW